ncbi:MAG: serine/threonine-protein kinase [Polyangiales bacterium]
MTSATDPPQSKLPGVIAGRYRPVRLLGRGGMGAVYEAVHTWTGRRVAVKTLLPHLAGDGGAVERFRREARAGVQGAHPHIVDVLDMGVDDDGAPYLAQELLLGEDLAALLAREGPLPVRRAYEILVPVMAALDAAHRAGVVHRDVKPGNVFLARGPHGAATPKVIDFGIAALSDAAPVTRTGAPVGTPQYMAPEQARGARDVDARADVWAAGCLWFEALAGRRPVDGDNYQAVMAALLTGPAPSLRAAAPSLPDGLCAAVEGALQPDRARRHRDMASFARALLAAPCCAGEAWGAALAEAFPFPDGEPAAPPAAEGPPTLDLPPATPPPSDRPDAPPRAENNAPPHTTAPTTRPSERPPRATAWRSIALVAIGAALASAAMLLLRAPPRETSRPSVAAPPAPPAPFAPTPAPEVAAVLRGAAAPAAPDAGVRAPPAAPAVRPVSAAPPVDARRRIRTRAGDAGVTRSSVINGAPVLEP